MNGATAVIEFVISLNHKLQGLKNAASTNEEHKHNQSINLTQTTMSPSSVSKLYLQVLII